MTSRIVWVSTERDIHLLEPDGSARQLTGLPDPALMWANWGQPSADSNSHTWPTFSPDGQWIATFRIDAQQGAVLVTDLKGVRSTVVMELPNQLPIYLQWSLDGQRVGVVSQLKDDLLLTTAKVDGSGSQRVLAKGSPLFFTWLEDDRVATFIGGGSPNARMLLLDADQRQPTEVLPGMPGDFCAPVLVESGMVYGAHLDGAAGILAYENGGVTRTLPAANGLMAFVPSPSGRYLARAVAPGGDGSAYRALTLIEVATGEETPIADIECLAFLWAGDDALVVANVDADRGLVEWQRVDLHGTRRHLIDLLPSRDMRFYLRFFEQYACSHPITDPDGRYVLLAGSERGRGASPRIWRVPVAGGPAEDLGPGRFACFGPRLPN